MGLVPSKTELFLPAETIRPCHPDRCWCAGGHHRSLKWVYTERGGDGRERNHDAMDMMRDFMMGAQQGGGGGSGGGGNYPMMPWRPAKDWSVRDYERLGEILNEYYVRENGRMGGGGGPGGGMMPNMQGMFPGGPGGPGGGVPPMMMNPGMMGGFDGSQSSGGGGSHRKRRYPSWSEFERMQESVEDKLRRMAEEYQRHTQERDAYLFGTDADVRKERYRSNMLKTMQELMPQLAQMMAGGPHMGGGGMNMPMGPMMGGPPGNMPPYGMNPGGQNPWGGNGGGGVNHMAAAAQQQAAMNQPAWGGDPMMMGAPPPMMEHGRRPSRFGGRGRKFVSPMDDGRFDQGLGGHMGGRSPWDNDDMLGGGGGYGPGEYVSSFIESNTCYYVRSNH